MADIAFTPQWVRADTNHYDQKLLDVGGASVANTYIPSSFTPFEQAAKNPATQQYLDEFAKYKPGAKAKALLGAQAWSAWLLFAESAKACGSDLTRKCVYDNAKKIHDWTGGGLHARHRPGCRQGLAVLRAPEGRQRQVHDRRRRAEHRHLQLQPAEPHGPAAATTARA